MTRIPDNIRAACADDIRAGQKSRAQIARDHGVSKASVTNIAAEAGISTPFDRSTTKKATEAVQADNRSARATEATGTIGVATVLRSSILTAENGNDAKGWAIAYGIFIDKHLALTKHDADPGVDAAKSMLGALARGLGAAYDQLTGPESDAG